MTHLAALTPMPPFGYNPAMDTAAQLHGMRIAILTDDAFEQVEMTQPRKALDEAGATTVLISAHTPAVQGWNHHDKGDSFQVDLALDQASPIDFDAVLLPGGALNADVLRGIQPAVSFVRGMAEAGKPIAAICHAPWILIEAGVARGRKLTSWPSLQTDLRNAGATWVDETVVDDNNLVTSRKPDDIPAFNKHMIGLFSKARDKAHA